MSSRSFAVTACALLFVCLPLSILAKEGDGNPGSLITPKGICPLKHTDVHAKISGPLARVTVTQEFENPFAEKIEAVYTFPLPPDSAVDDMTMLVGDHTIRGLIKPREEARKIYDDARRAGQVAGLLDQERPNIFTQAVANIMPGAKVKIVISYVETMPYEAGTYAFNFPMVVAPRYMPGHPTGKQGGGWAPDTTRVPDASRISPNVTPEGTRAGHDISVEVSIEAGVPIDSLESKTHDVAVDRPSGDRAVVHLRDKATIPNKDFILKYAVAGKRVEDAVLTHKGANGGFFTLMLQPPERVTSEEATPKELVFVLDTSGSMSGFPIEKAKETMRMALDGLNPRDTFNLITFSGDTRILFPSPVPATPDNIRAARQLLDGAYGSGGTEMMRAIRAAFAPSGDPGHVRVICFMTDGEVGNDLDIIAEVQKHADARVFAFGIGSSVNHFLLDNMARYGRGEVEYVGLRDDGSAAARRFYERIRNPLLTDISVDWGGLAVSEVIPARIPDLFAAKPMVISGRYSAAGNGVIRLKGKMAGRDFTREIRVSLPASQPENDVLATLWARRRVADLMSQDFHGLQRGTTGDDLKAQITKLGMEFRLMTQFTSFVAVEEKTVTEGGVPRRVDVPVEMPEGMSYEGVFGREMDRDMAVKVAASPMPVMGGFIGGSGGNRPSGMPMSRQAAGPQQVAPPRPRPMKDELKANLAARLDPIIQALIQRVKSGGRPSVDEARFVFGDRAYVRITLNGASPAALEVLRNAGLVITKSEGNVVVGHVAVAQLEPLSTLPIVSFIAPR
ncbi:MAG TPA: VIT and VWA domain-containing protein [Bryobacteraceae bacterium]|nr:VIT and VWA domain-containing protein [Bryobacteraceae bacterium]